MKQDHLKQTKTPPSAAPPAGKPGLSALKSGVGIESLCILIIVLATTLIYSNTLNSPFVLDDHSSISGNRHIRISEISVGSILNSFREKASRPVPIISFALNYYFGKYNPLGYHLVNIIIHALNGTVLFWLIKATLNIRGRQRNQVPNALFLPDSVIAFIGALLWTVHPVNTQSVTYIVQRMNSLAALFCLLALIGYIKGRLANERQKSTAWFTAALVAWLLALGSKQTAAIMPFTILFYEWYFFQDLSPQWFRRNLKYFIGGVLVCGAIAFIFLGSDPIGKLSSLRDFSEARFTLTERVLTQFRVLVYYLSLFVYPNPSRLNLDYDFALSHSLFDPLTTLFSALLLAGLIGTGILTAKKHRLLSFCIFWYFLNLVIESSVIPLAIIFEHRTYLPFMGLALLTVLLVDRYLKLFWPKVVLFGLMVTVCALWTYQRNETWKDPVILWQDVVNKSTTKARPHSNLGRVLHKNEKDDAAIEHFKAALKIEPHHHDALNNLGLILMDQNKTAEAIAYFKTALVHYPQDKETLNNLGRALDKQKKPDEALARFKAALQTDPEFPYALNNIGAILKDQNRNTEAVVYFKAAVKSDPYFVEALNNLGAVSMDQGKVAEAMGYFKRALEIDPVNIEALNNIGEAYQEQNRSDTALGFFRDALKIDPQDVTALNHLGLAHISMGDISKAAELFEQASKIDPSDSESHVNLGATYSKLGQFELANLHLQEALILNPKLAKAHTNLGIVLIQMGDFQKGFFHIQKAVELEPDNESFQSNRNQAQAIETQIRDHIAALREALEKDPRNPDLLAELASLYQSIGDSTSAIAALLRALEIKPDSDALLNSIGNLYLENAQYEQALAIFEKHLALAPGFSLPSYNMARLKAKQNRLSEAAQWLKNAIDHGYTNWSQIKSDPCFNNLRKTAEYQALIKEP